MRGLGVSLDLLKGPVAGDGHDFVWRCCVLCQCRSGGLADSVSRAMRKVRLAAPVLELVSEAVSGERLAELRDKERRSAGSRRRDAGR